MNRRQLLTALAAAPALLVPELWTPKRSFFLPPAQGWAAPSLVDLWDAYAREVSACAFCGQVLVNI